MLTKEKVVDVLKKAKKIDKELNVFGACSHKYKLNPVTTIEKVEEFEEKYGIKLPKEYVNFLTKIGNGGAGPDYGLFPLERVEAYNHEWLEKENDALPLFEKSFDIELWEKIQDDYEDLFSEEEYNNYMNRFYSGMLVIGTRGCTYDTVLMYKGDETGKIVFIDWNLEGNCPPYVTGIAFEDWYYYFFDEISKNRNVSSYPYRILESEEELIEHYKNSTVVGEKRLCISSFDRFQTISEKTIDFLMNINDAEIDESRLFILNHFDKEKASKAAAEVLKSDHPENVYSIAYELPEELVNLAYENLIGILNSESADNDKKNLIEIIAYCKSIQLKDVSAHIRKRDEYDNFTRWKLVNALYEKKSIREEELSELLELIYEEEYEEIVLKMLTIIKEQLKIETGEVKECFEYVKNKYKGCYRSDFYFRNL